MQRYIDGAKGYSASETYSGIVDVIQADISFLAQQIHSALFMKFRFVYTFKRDDESRSVTDTIRYSISVWLSTVTIG